MQWWLHKITKLPSNFAHIFANVIKMLFVVVCQELKYMKKSPRGCIKGDCGQIWKQLFSSHGVFPWLLVVTLVEGSFMKLCWQLHPAAITPPLACNSKRRHSHHGLTQTIMILSAFSQCSEAPAWLITCGSVLVWQLAVWRPIYRRANEHTWGNGGSLWK